MKLASLSSLALALIALLTALPAPVHAVQADSNPHGPLPAELTCEDCHTPAAWSPLRDPLAFVHGEASGFELTGAHTGTACIGCHLDLRFDAPRIQPLECQACHEDPHQGRLVDSCAACHTTRTFYDVDGELAHARTALPLTGAHLQVPCETCHADDRVSFTGLDPECIGCHLDAYQASPVLDHEAAGFSTDCTECHSDLGWADSPLFDHESASGGWPLVEAHAGVRCSGCHQVPGMEPLFPAQSPEDCYACHQDDYEAVHSGGFPTSCTDCHGQSTWEGADFDHAADAGFPLEGVHDRLACSACHTIPGYGLIFPVPAAPDDCVACHQADYDREHAGEGYPTTCALCHGVNEWDADFRHDSEFFPIFSGTHAGRWNDCAECHVVPSDFNTFSCIDCHEHNAADTGADHSEVPNYLYESAGCYSCHPTGD